MRYRTINEGLALETWSQAITESTKISDPAKLQWMSNFLQINENMLIADQGGNINESYGVQGPEAVPGRRAHGIARESADPDRAPARRRRRGHDR